MNHAETGEGRQEAVTDKSMENHEDNHSFKPHVVSSDVVSINFSFDKYVLQLQPQIPEHSTDHTETGESRQEAVTNKSMQNQEQSHSSRPYVVSSDVVALIFDLINMP